VVSRRADLPISAVAAIAERAVAGGWDDAIPMAGGEPGFDIPKAAMLGLSRADNDLVTKYSPFRGHPRLLDGIQCKLRDINGLEVSTDEIIVVPGGAAGLFSAVAVLLTPERRRVVLTDPCWEHYPNIVRAAEGDPVRVRTLYEGNHNRIDLCAFDELLDDRTAAVLLNTPLNPTGSILRPDELLAVYDRCQAVGATLVVDEEYETFIYGRRHHMTARSSCPEAVSVFSFSKSFALTGIRLGYVTAPPEIIDALKRFGLYTYMYPASPSQVMAAAVLEQDQTSYLHAVRQEYERKAAFLSQQLGQLNTVTCAMPEGGVYVFPCMQQEDGTSLALDLIEEQHVLCVPGEVAGISGKGHVRFFIGLEEDLTHEALRRIGMFVSSRRSR
jgi:aspartate/methionine/tyrosine aminotransferase